MQMIARTLPLKDETSLENSLKVIENFTKVSDMKLNIFKTECILTGPIKYLSKTIFKKCNYKQ
jgi:hypothetical protein